MADILDIEHYINDLIRQGITSDELVSRIIRGLNRLEDLFLAHGRRDARNAI